MHQDVARLESVNASHVPTLRALRARSRLIDVAPPLMLCVALPAPLYRLQPANSGSSLGSREPRGASIRSRQDRASRARLEASRLGPRAPSVVTRAASALAAAAARRTFEAVSSAVRRTRSLSPPFRQRSSSDAPPPSVWLCALLVRETFRFPDPSDAKDPQSNFCHPMSSLPICTRALELRGSRRFAPDFPRRTRWVTPAGPLRRGVSRELRFFACSSSRPPSPLTSPSQPTLLSPTSQSGDACVTRQDDLLRALL